MGSENYAYWMELKTKDDSVYGYARTEIMNTEYFSVFKLKGIIKNDSLLYEEYDIYKTKERTKFGWCLIEGYILLDSYENCVSGKWVSNTANCGTGSLLLYKSLKKFNKGESILNKYISINELKSSKKGDKVVLSKIYFNSNEYKISSKSSFNELDTVLNYLKKNTQVTINVQGHTDNLGTDENNMKLSYRRAECISNYLIKNGIDKSRIVYEGYGKSRPISNNDGNKSLNRRVEIEIEEN